MNTKELQLNNLFLDQKNRICRVVEIRENLDECRIEAINGPITSLPFKPIVVTEEILKQLSCDDRFFSDKDYKPGYIGIDIKCGGMILDFVLTKPFKMGEWQDYYAIEIGSHRFLKLPFLHDLQNAFRVFTGNGLDISQKMVDLIQKMDH